jgi:type IV pilus assembly protein PilC
MDQKIKSKWNLEIDFSGVSDLDILTFTKHLSVSLKSGLTLSEGIDIVLDQAKGKWRKMLLDISDMVKAGSPLYKALDVYSKYFTSIYVSTVKSGELSGTLARNLERLSKQLYKSRKLKKKIKSAMIYPMFIFVAVVGLGFSVAIFVLPKILPLFKMLGTEIPLTTRWLIAIAELFESHALAIIFGFIGLCIFLTWFLTRNFVKPVTHRIILRIPVFGKLSKNIIIERFTRNLGTLLNSGVPIASSLKISREAMDNREYNGALAAVVLEVESGGDLKTALSAYPFLFPSLVSKMIGVGEKTGNLSETLKYVADYYEDEIGETVRNLSTMLEPILLITIGILVGLVAMSILGPIYQITGSLA